MVRIPINQWQPYRHGSHSNQLAATIQAWFAFKSTSGNHTGMVRSQSGSLPGYFSPTKICTKKDQRQPSVHGSHYSQPATTIHAWFTLQSAYPNRLFLRAQSHFFEGFPSQLFYYTSYLITFDLNILSQSRLISHLPNALPSPV